jgi:hypothetical protein
MFQYLLMASSPSLSSAVDRFASQIQAGYGRELWSYVPPFVLRHNKKESLLYVVPEQNDSGSEQ